MRGVTASLLLVLALGAMGCGKPPARPLVYVDLSRVDARAPQVPESIEIEGKTMPGDRFELAARTSKELQLGLSSDRLRAALEESRQQRERTIEKLMARRKAASEAALDADEREGRQKIDEEKWGAVAGSLDATREPFEKRADEIGRLTRELTNLLWFPDPGNGVLPEAEWAKKRAARADEIRARLQDLDNAYWAELRETLDRIERDTGERIRQLEERLRLERVAETARLSLEEQAMRQRARSFVVSNPAFGLLQIQFPPQSAQQLSLPVVMPLGVQEPAAPRPEFERRHLEKLLQAWASVRGYTLVGSPDQGEDRTQEFQQWHARERPGP